VRRACGDVTRDPRHPEEVVKPRITLLTLGVDDLERALRFYRDTFWGGYAGYFQDPDGHLWEVAWNPQWTFPE
jgi:predicted lactoylglutathione lyase